MTTHEALWKAQVWQVVSVQCVFSCACVVWVLVQKLVAVADIGFYLLGSCLCARWVFEAVVPANADERYKFNTILFCFQALWRLKDLKDVYSFATFPSNWHRLRVVLSVRKQCGVSLTHLLGLTEHLSNKWNTSPTALYHIFDIIYLPRQLSCLQPCSIGSLRLPHRNLMLVMCATHETVYIVDDQKKKRRLCANWYE